MESLYLQFPVASGCRYYITTTRKKIQGHHRLDKVPGGQHLQNQC